jgi:tetratricopeptide (TPR) repeat protein
MNFEEEAWVEKYLLDELSEEERSAFEKIAQEDQDLKRRIDEHRVLIDGLRKGFNRELKHMLREEESKIQPTEARKKERFLSLRNPWMIAASVSLLLVAGVVFLPWNNVSGEAIYDKYYQTYPNILNPVTRSGQPEKSGFWYYEAADYKNALMKFEQDLSKNPDHPGLNFYAGISQIELQQYRAALASLHKVVKADDAALSKPALWYIALVNLKTGRKKAASKALKTLSAGEDTYARKASEILHAM